MNTTIDFKTAKIIDSMSQKINHIPASSLNCPS